MNAHIIEHLTTDTPCAIRLALW
jgi:tetratricopeptide (TPR) repeat protein